MQTPCRALQLNPTGELRPQSPWPILQCPPPQYFPQVYAYGRWYYCAVVFQINVGFLVIVSCRLISSINLFQCYGLSRLKVLAVYDVAAYGVANFSQHVLIICVLFYYAALIRRRGGRILRTLHSVCPSVCPSVRPSRAFLL